MSKRVVRAEGSRVRLVILNEEDAEVLVNFINDPKTFIFLATMFPIPIHKEREWIKGLLEKMDTEPTFGIELIETGELIGVMGLHKINFVDRTATTGALIGPEEYRGRGYGTEAKLLLLEYAFNTLNLRIIYSSVFSFNMRSKAYSLKCGYKEVARLEQKFFRGGEYADEIILQVTREDFLKARSQHQK